MGLLTSHSRRIRVILMLCLLGLGSTQGQPSREYPLKAAFLYNFAAFVEWPEPALGGPMDPFVVGILGADPFGAAIDEIVAGEQAKNRPLIVQRFTDPADAANAHILFISESEAPRLAAILQHCRERPVLTVSDIPGFAAEGGVIEFRVENTVRLHINVSAARSGQLTISSKLLQLAEVVPGSMAP